MVASKSAAPPLEPLSISRWTMVLPAGAGHLPHQEKPGAVLEAIRDDGRLFSAGTNKFGTDRRLKVLTLEIDRQLT